MAVMSAIHPTTYAPLCVEVGEFLPLYVKILMKVRVNERVLNEKRREL